MSRAQQQVRERWSYRWHDQETNQSHSGSIRGIESHAHPNVLVTNDGQRFVIMDLSAGHRLDDRVLIYEPSGKLIRSLGVREILLFHDRSDVSHSVSHTWWVGYDQDRKASYWLSDDGSSLHVMTKAGTPALISLRTGRVTRPGWTHQLLQHSPRFWSTAMLGLLLARILIVDHDNSVRLSLGLSSVIVGLLGVQVWLVWRNTISFWFGFSDWQPMRSAIFAVGSVLLVWIIFARTGWAAHLITLGIGVAAMSLAIALTYRTELEPLTRTALGAVAGMLVLLGAIASKGYRLRRVLSPLSGTAQLPARPTAQLQILHLLFCVGFTATCMAVVRLQVFKQVHSQPGLQLVLDGFLISGLAAAIAWTALTARTWALFRCGLIIAVIAAALTLAPNAFRWRGFNLRYWHGIVCYTGFLFGLLLIVRLHGFRLMLAEQDPHLLTADGPGADDHRLVGESTQSLQEHKHCREHKGYASHRAQTDSMQRSVP